MILIIEMPYKGESCIEKKVKNARLRIKGINIFQLIKTNRGCAPRQRASNLTGAKPVWKGLATHQ